MIETGLIYRKTSRLPHAARALVEVAHHDQALASGVSELHGAASYNL
jgi:hypothetical protein